MRTRKRHYESPPPPPAKKPRKKPPPKVKKQAEPVQAEEPVQQAGRVQSDEHVLPEVHVQRAEPIRLDEPVRVEEPIQEQPIQEEPNHEEEPNQAEQPNQPDDPNQAEDPNQANDPNQVEDPNQANDPNQVEDPNQAEEPNQPEEPNVAEDETQPEAENEAEELNQPDDPIDPQLALPLDVLELVYRFAALGSTKQIMDLSDLPSNGKGNQYPYKALVHVIKRAPNKYIRSFLKSLSWERIKIFFGGNTNEPRWHYDQEDLIERLKRTERYRRPVRILELTLDSWRGVVIAPLLDKCIEIFKIFRRDQIREVSLCLVVTTRNKEYLERARSNINTILGVVHTFRNLTDFKVVMDTGATISESHLAHIIQDLPKVKLIILRGFSNEDKLLEFDANLGVALASRTELTSLNIGNLRTFTRDWLHLKWHAPLQELTIDTLDPASGFHPSDLLRFFHIFHRTLVSIYFVRGPIDYPALPEDVASEQTLARDFTSLKYLTYKDHLSSLWTFAHSPNLELLTWHLLEDDIEASFEPFRVHHFPNEERWTSLKKVHILVPHVIAWNFVPLARARDFGTWLGQFGISFEPDASCPQVEEYESLREEFWHLDSKFYPRPYNLTTG